ncbi:hypothetical protein K435DRAFT_778951 [Dendrothele bispora CBS 962.96]|uniref:NADH dehydrogenase [ubiquinone] iron-sulfur protein 5 n=1 Tax=Dendrothele bispora (strain CBS 962.96) TaxID=1314807 RepID=A0A4S8M1K6_DENBC|nr:hypothetical protein K435DRAFT_784189 [Dendrothele bispora CBS 962.96]THU95483.1 hypothetical protein K435DRAFT_778951 [Dendrothele bispora CBS 962.96]
MASGYGWGGGRSRCFAYWQEFSKCYAQADHPQECRAPADDYVECLHHTKEAARAKAIQDEFIRQAQAKAKEDRKAADVLSDGVIVGVGLIQRGGDGK